MLLKAWRDALRALSSLFEELAPGVYTQWCGARSPVGGAVWAWAPFSCHGEWS